MFSFGVHSLYLHTYEHIYHQSCNVTIGNMIDNKLVDESFIVFISRDQFVHKNLKVKFKHTINPRNFIILKMMFKVETKA